MVKRVAIIGAGVSGLTSIKCCLEEGLEPTCFERSADIGGLWQFTEYVEEGRASIYKSVVTNNSKEMSCYSDFPFPEDFPNFVPHSKFLEYLKMYANKFNLLKCIQFKTVVCNVKKCPDFSTSGQWEVTTEHEGKKESAVFDAVMVCTGFLTDPFLPLDTLPGINTFKGQYFHSREYKNPDLFKDKRVLVIGMGNSGADIAVDASRVAKKVLLSTTGGAWVFNRFLDHGYPTDMMVFSRFKSTLKDYVPTSLVNWFIGKKGNSWFEHGNYGLVPENRTFLREPVVNGELPGCILTGKVLIKPRVEKVKENSVVFKNTPEEEPIDIIVLATGYTFAFPFLDQSIVKVENNQASLYKYIFPAHLEKPTLAVIGLIKPTGSLSSTSEVQARWVTRVLKGLNKLPSPEAMREDINRVKANKATGFGVYFNEILQTDYLTYIDELLSYINAKPNLLSMFLVDPLLAFKVFFGPLTSYQHRLTGPGKWDGARNAILTQWDRTIKPTKTRVVQEPPDTFSYLLKVFSFLALLVAIFLIF
ncbi:dimethylaniline monooxygenase [N-oxide-forming] 1-like isoform X1 [Trichosurus vulpecula]|uniref:dimethylaniline monooxygenase [N-oxide-forming] 1-like isoform X1 n=2 Tax=Trichosurus vulpecula TaxID=9337 RepID=UPI00186B2FE9|nr:dimethylaniline monooxygenase [N-oxide-forming] 1-like isoform X1 [Trichosurus vulpecula]